MCEIGNQHPLGWDKRRRPLWLLRWMGNDPCHSLEESDFLVVSRAVFSLLDTYNGAQQPSVAL